MTPPNRLPQARSFKSLTVRAFATVATLSLLIALAAAPAQAQYAQDSQPPYPQSQYQPNPYAGQYAQPQAYAQPSYAQPNYAQPGYAQQTQPYPQQPNYQQPSYQQPYAQQPYPAPNQQYGQAPPDPFQSQSPQSYDQSQGYSPLDSGPSQPPAQPLSPDQLEQLVAPIALYPDALVAQVLAAATYPAQVVGADHWLQAQGNAPQDQIAYGANAQSWDPSVKALTAFPQVLAQMDQNLQWTTDLGNAYFNQPQDVLQTVQVLRQRAQSAGTLQSTPQEAVNFNQGYIQIAPVNPQVVYVPSYNPWDVYGQPIQPYSGFSLWNSLQSIGGSSAVRFGLGIAMSAFNNTPFGWAGWALNWITQSVLFNHSNYMSHSTTVAHWNLGGERGFPSRASRGFDGYNRSAGYARSGDGFNHAYNGGNNRGYERSPAQSFVRPAVRTSGAFGDNRTYNGYRASGETANRGYQQSNGSAGPALQNNYAYNRQPSSALSSRGQSYDRSGYGSGYGSTSYGRSGSTYGSAYGAGQNYAGRSGSTYSSAPSQRAGFAQRSPQYGVQSYSGGRSYASSMGRNYAQSNAPRSGGFFGGRGESQKSYGSYKAPKGYGGGKEFKQSSHGSSHSGGGHSGGGHHGGHRL